MTKPEILEAVKRMLADWEKAKKMRSSSSVVLKSYCHEGFCYWLAKNNIKKRPVIIELGEDIDFEKKLKMSSFWYEQVFLLDDNFKEILQTRIDHLQRTIARLEKEITNETIAP